MAPPVVTIKGLYRLRSTLKKAGADMAALKLGNLEAERIVVARAQQIAPKRTGKLAGSLKTPKLAARATVKSDLIYAGMIHWGWARRNIRPQPFLTKAAEQTRDQWLPAYQRNVQQVANTVQGV
jgi:hypothetical protein